MQQIAEAIRDGSCVVFAGAGISRDADLPDWLGLVQALYDRLKAKGRIRSEYQAPLETLFSTKENILTGLDILLSAVYRQTVVTELRTLLTTTKESKVHQKLKNCKIRGFITTNYDRLLDDIIDRNAYNLTNSLSDLKIVPAAVLKDIGVQFLVKLHGDIDNALPPDDMTVIKGGPFMILSHVDYMVLKTGRLDELRLALHAVLQQYSVLFLGYGYGDPDIRLVLEFLSEHCQFARESWFIAKQGDQVPALPANVRAVHPIKDWSELADWLGGVCEEARRRSTEQTTPQKPTGGFATNEEEKAAAQAISEYILGLESENLAAKTIATIIISKLSDRQTIDLPSVSNWVSDLLNIGPAWADTLARAALNELVELRVLAKPETTDTYRILTDRLQQLRNRAESEWSQDRKLFFHALERRLAKAGVPQDPTFFEHIDSLTQDFCMRFAKRIAQWIHSGIGRDLGLSQIRDFSRNYFASEEEQRKASELLQLVLEDPRDEEAPYVYRLLSSCFLLNSVKLDPSTVNFIRERIFQYELYLDSNILLPLIISEHRNHKWVTSVIKDSKAAGTQIYVIEPILNEVYGHRRIAEEIFRQFSGDTGNLSVYAESLGQRVNCFVQGYLSLPKTNRPHVREFLQLYKDNKVLSRLDEQGIKVVKVGTDNFDSSEYAFVYNAICEEWSQKIGSSAHYSLYGTSGGSVSLIRPTILNENEAIQFLYLYRRREDRVSKGMTDDVWFLSFETVLERVFQKDPQRWRKAPTFPLSAWASFLDARLNSEPQKRKDVLSAILKGNSSAFSLPDSVTLVKRKAFGQRVLSKEESEATKTAFSDDRIFSRFEKAVGALKRRNTEGSLAAKEFVEAQKDVVGEIKDDLNEQLRNLKDMLTKKEKVAMEEVTKLKRQLVELQAQKKPRRHGKRK